MVARQGLGSGPKQEVLGKLLIEASASGNDAAAVFVEDRLLTLDKTMADPTLRTKVLPVLAGWGYNTLDQRAAAMSNGYTVSPLDIATLLRMCDPARCLCALGRIR